MENAAQTGSSDRRGRANESAISRFLAGAYLVFFFPFRSIPVELKHNSQTRTQFE